MRERGDEMLVSFATMSVVIDLRTKRDRSRERSYPQKFENNHVHSISPRAHSFSASIAGDQQRFINHVAAGNHRTTAHLLLRKMGAFSAVSFFFPPLVGRFLFVFEDKTLLRLG